MERRNQLIQKFFKVKSSEVTRFLTLLTGSLTSNMQPMKLFSTSTPNIDLEPEELKELKFNLYEALKEAVVLARDFKSFSIFGGEMSDVRVSEITIKNAQDEAYDIDLDFGVKLIASLNTDGSARNKKVSITMSLEYNIVNGPSPEPITKHLIRPVELSFIKNLNIQLKAGLDLKSVASKSKSFAKWIHSLLQQQKTNLVGSPLSAALILEADLNLKNYSAQSIPVEKNIFLTREDGVSGTQLAFNILTDILVPACLQVYNHQPDKDAQYASYCPGQVMPKSSLNFQDSGWLRLYEKLPREGDRLNKPSPYVDSIIPIRTCSNVLATTGKAERLRQFFKRLGYIGRNAYTVGIPSDDFLYWTGDPKPYVYQHTRGVK